MKHVLLIIGGLLLLSAGRGVQVVEEEEGASLERRQQELAIEVLSLYLEVDSSRMSEHVVLTQWQTPLWVQGRREKSLIRHLFIRL